MSGTVNFVMIATSPIRENGFPESVPHEIIHLNYL